MNHVRDTPLRLEEAALIQFTGNRGFQIVETGPSDVAGIFALRLGIESPAAYRAALVRTEEQLVAAHEMVFYEDTTPRHTGRSPSRPGFSRTAS